MKVYLDYNLLCGIAKQDREQEELDALEKIRERYKAGRLDLRISQVHHRELEPYGDLKKKENIKQLLSDFMEVPIVEDSELQGFNIQWDYRGGFISSPRMEDDPICRDLRQIPLKRRDAHHLMVAARAGCDAFLTCDKRTILNRREEIERQLSGIQQIRLMKPSAFVKKVTLDETGKVIWSAP